MCYKQKCKVVSLNLAHPVEYLSALWNTPECTKEIRQRFGKGTAVGGGGSLKNVCKGLFCVNWFESQVNESNFVAVSNIMRELDTQDK